MPVGPARAAEDSDVRLADERLLDEDADLGVPALREEVRPEDRLVGHRAHRQRERPLAQPVLGAGDADRGNVEAFLDRFAVGTQLSVIAGPKTARQPSSTSSPYASITALTVPFGRPSTSRNTISTGRSMTPCFSPSSNTSSKRLRQVVPHLLREAVGQHEVEEVAELDRLCGALVGHVVPPTARAVVRLEPNSCSMKLPAPPAHVGQVARDHLRRGRPSTTGSSVSGPATAARAARRSGSPSAMSRPAAISTRVDATSRSPAVSSRRMACAELHELRRSVRVDAGLVGDDLLLDVGRREVELDGDHALAGRVLQVLEHALVAGVVRHDQAELRARRRARRRAVRSEAGDGGRRVDGARPSCPGALRRPRRGSRSRPRARRASAVRRPTRVSPPSSRKRPTRSAVVRSSWQATVIERPIEVVGHRLDEAGLAAAGRALEQDRQALPEGRLEDLLFVPDRHVVRPRRHRLLRSLCVGSATSLRRSLPTASADRNNGPITCAQLVWPGDASRAPLRRRRAAARQARCGADAEAEAADAATSRFDQRAPRVGLAVRVPRSRGRTRIRRTARRAAAAAFRPAPRAPRRHGGSPRRVACTPPATRPPRRRGDVAVEVVVEAL